MAHDSKVVQFSGQGVPQRFSLPSELVRLRDTSGQLLKTVLGEFFDQADDTLFSLADRAASNQDQTAYFDAMRELRLRRKSMTVSVLQYVSQAFNELGRFRPSGSAGSLEEVDQDSLGLVDNADLEQQVAIDNLTNRLRNQYQESVRMLAARVRHLAPDLDLADEQMPLSPEVICGGLAEASSDLDIDIRSKLVVLKLFERLLVDKLDRLYRDCNKLLVSAGVLPDMKRPPVAGAPPVSARPRPSRPSAARPAESSDDEEGGQSLTFNELSALLHQQGGPVVESNARGKALATSDLLSQLDELQVAASNTETAGAVPLREQLQPLLGNASSGDVSVGQADSDVINLVAMLFDFILEDRQLHPVMKSLIGRLQIPVLKVALKDANFFNRGGHPVRKLLNELALAAIGWSEKRAGARDPLREKIEQVVDRILNEFTEGTELFQELLEDFTHFMDLDRRRRELVEQRLKDAEEGRAKQERASQAAAEVITDHIAGRDVPETVQQILNEPWTRYLQWVALRWGEGTEQWQEACAKTGRLVWSVDPSPVSDETRQQLLRSIPEIVEEFRAALQEISWDPFATDAAVRDLELAHVDVFQKLVTAPVEPAPVEPVVAPEAETEAEALAPLEEPVTAPADEEPDLDMPQLDAAPAELPEAPEPAKVVAEAPTAKMAEPEEAAPAIDEKWLNQADRLRVGSWVELLRDDQRSRCKLAAFIKATGKYIFVNRSGAKVAEYHREDLAQALAEGDITLLDDGLIFDRALESIIDNLRHNRRD